MMIDWNSNIVRNLIDLFGATAILVGLIFVGLELRQNTAAVQSTALQNQTTESTSYLMSMANNPDLTRIWLKAANTPEDLDEVEKARLQFFIRAQWFRYQSSFQEWRAGTLSDEAWSVYAKFICQSTEDRYSAGGAKIRRSTWHNHRGALSTQLVEYVENCWGTKSSVAN
jgi:hypothetical protein